MELTSKDGIGFLSLGEGNNLWTLARLKECTKLVKKARRDKDVRVLVIEGNKKFFSAGADVKELVDFSKAKAKRFAQAGVRLCQAIERFPKPVIAAMQGYALGGGFEVALSADIRIASRDAVLGMPEVKLGIVPGFGGLTRLTQFLGPKRTKLLVLSGHALDVQEAHSLGLVDMVSDKKGFMKRVRAIAKELMTRSPQAQKRIKQFFSEDYKKDIRAFAGCFGKEQKEGMQAFLDKRDPVWKP